jgi:asparagine synthase (glutamine-hydrolysing)
MSGLALFYNRDGAPAEQLDMERMLGALARRGPDGAAVWYDGALAVGHCSLRTTPEAFHEAMPLTSRCGRSVISADVRLDNRDELIARLGLNDRPRHQLGDGAITLAAYQRWGSDCPARLLGDFAFVIWDAPARRLFCARDDYGVKPLYYTLSEAFFAAASEVAALLALPRVPRHLDETRVAEYFVSRLEGDSDSNTFYSAIRRLPGGSWLVVRPGGVEQRRWRTFAHVPEQRYGSDAEYAAAFRHLFEQVVDCRLRSSGALGSMLSGGVDSTSIVCVAEREFARSGQLLPTFSAVGDDPATCPERPYLATLPAELALLCHTVGAGQVQRYIGGYAALLQGSGDPFAAAGLIPPAMYAAAQAQRVRVMLDGVDGDIVASLDPDYPAHLARGGRWLRLVTELQGATAFWGESLWATARDTCVWPLLPRAVRQGWTRLRYHQAEDTSLLDPDFVRRAGIWERIEASQLAGGTPAPSLRESHVQRVSVGYLQSALERYDHAAACFGIESRHPLLDRRLVEFCIGLPPELKVRRGWTKVILRGAMAGVIPEPIRRRRDRNNPSSAFVRHALAQLGDTLATTFEGDLSDLGVLLRPDALRALYRRYRADGNIGDGHRLWEALAFVLWWRRTTLVPSGWVPGRALPSLALPFYSQRLKDER